MLESKIYTIKTEKPDVFLTWEQVKEEPGVYEISAKHFPFYTFIVLPNKNSQMRNLVLVFDVRDGTFDEANPHNWKNRLFIFSNKRLRINDL